MGCGNSKNQIHVVSTGTTVDNTKTGVTLKNNDKSLNDTRGGSASSKASKHSCDSGFDDDGYNKVITESSKPEKIKQIEELFKIPRDLELGVVGQACPQRLSAKDKERLQEQRILATLQQEGLITRPMSRATFGVSFEVIEASSVDNGFLPRRPPARLAKLEKRKKKRKLTEEEIQAKMARAEERRKEREQQRLAKIQAVTMKSDITNALSSQTAHQETVKTETKAKIDQALENREKRMEELKEKLRRKEEHAEAVRRRRALAPIQTNDEEEAELIRSRNFTEDTPIPMIKP
ncbi:hypothetical protein LSH36_25g10024 [Paralvinella palmiformis]|uniref:Stathmin n=1 Tax=Paralvinella palmiformis TaxID=53620 RepID=A0AAD9NF45_9ANNE|nr:hypothetical protein LSH36_25g10024 [Paralvinella palmiformis]